MSRSVLRNIPIVYMLALLKNMWFWLGIWVFYYLKFTDYAGIGIIETSLIFSMTISEVPTGAIADLLGKKKTLTISFLLEAVGLLGMAAAQNLWGFVIFVFIAGIGGSLYSGTAEALVFDSLKQVKKEKTYQKVIAKITSLQLIAPALSGILGGFLYTIQPRLPYFLHGIAYALGFVFTLFLIEPVVDTVRFSAKAFVRQMGQGIKQLFFSSEIIRQQTLFLLGIGFVIVVFDEMFNGFLGYEYGFSERELAVLWAIIFLASAMVSQLSPRLEAWLGNRKTSALLTIVLGISCIIAAVAHSFLGAFVLLVLTATQALFTNTSSTLINNAVDSRIRATTLSTFNMIKNTPYMLLAYIIGRYANIYSAKTVSFFFGLFLLCLFFIQWHIVRSKKAAVLE